MAKKATKIKQPREVKIIAPEEILESFIKTKFTPLQKCDYIKKIGNKQYACAIGAFYVESAMNANRSIPEVLDFIKTYNLPIAFELAYFNGYDNDYISGFVSGFDGVPLYDMACDEYKLGYTDGRSSWRLVSKYA